MASSTLMLTLVYVLTMVSNVVISIPIWDHAVNLNDDYRLLWTVNRPQPASHFDAQEITFEVQVRTQGYIGFGFSRDGSRTGADIVIGWVEHGQTYFQVREMNSCSLFWHCVA